MFYYNEKIDTNGVIYSVDMIRLNIVFFSEKQQLFCDNLSNYENNGNIIITYYSSFKFLNFRHLWKIDCKYSDVVNDMCTVTIGMDFYGYKESRDLGFIEFNPNKCMNSKYFCEILELVKNASLHMRLNRYDLAIDIPTERRNVRLVRDRRKYELIENKGSLTEYLGKRSESGFVKLYDKQKESDLKYVLTRLELTLDTEKTIDKVFPEVYIVDTQKVLYNATDLNDTELVLLELLTNSDTPQYYLKRCGRVVQNKLKNYLVYDNIFNYNDKICRELRVFVESFVV